ncbi:MAG: hypothetical protein FWD14_00355 [Treponema sp.]|nr:hypothetical protein [Treponema sp.]
MITFRKTLYVKTGFYAFISFYILITAGCAVVKPMNLETIDKFGLNHNIEMYKHFQYFISRDIVLSTTNIQTDRSVAGQAMVNTRINRNVKQFLASTPGVCLEVDSSGSVLRLGIAFENDNNNLLWFFYHEATGLYFLEYTNNSGREIDYGGVTYKVTFEYGRGFGAFVKRMFTKDRTKGANFRRLEPLLLFEENTRNKEKIKRSTARGRRL